MSQAYFDIGIDTVTNNAVAIKIEPLAKNPAVLTDEVAFYRLLSGGAGIPHIHWSGVEGDFTVMVFQLLGPSLEDLFNFCGRKFGLKTVLLLADQIICRLCLMHTRDVLHQDVKPENFLMGLGNSGHTV